MFSSLNLNFFQDLTCREEAHYLKYSDFDWYNKVGFQLNIAERKFLQSNRINLSECLNQQGWHQEWLTLNKHYSLTSGLQLDRCSLLHRANFAEDALAQINCYKHPCAVFMSNSKPKWGLNFAVNHLNEERNAIEVLNIELDDYDLNRIQDKKIELEQWIMKQDWLDLAKRVRDHSNEWQMFKISAQSEWKARYLLGWTPNEYAAKSCAFS